MSKDNNYYLNKGKLKLNMLDDDVYSNIIANNKDNIEVGKLKVNKDIYNTLHYMGKFITKGAQKDKEQINKRMLKRIAKSAKVNDVTIPLDDNETTTPVLNDGVHLLEHTVQVEDNPQGQLYITHSDEKYHKIEQNGLSHTVEAQEGLTYDHFDIEIIDTPVDYIDANLDYDSQRPLPIDECMQLCREIKVDIMDEEVQEEHKATITQKEVDAIVEDILEFKYIDDDFHNELRKHIQNKISLIEEGQYQE